MCCESTSYSDVVQENRRFWEKREEDAATMIWQIASTLGVKGIDEEMMYDEETKGMENGDQEG